MTPDEPTHAPITSVTKAVALQRQTETVALGNAIAELAARIQAATYELLVMVREFDERGGWGRGFQSCAHWLNWRTGLALGAAREKVRVARALGELPRLSEAMRLGSISYSKIRAITRVATPATEERLLDFARCATASHVERLGFSCRGVRLNSVASSVTARLAASSSRLVRRTPRQENQWPPFFSTLVVRGRLSPEVGAVLQRALDAAADRLYQESKAAGATAAGGPDPEQRTMAAVSAEQRRADALGLVAESAVAADLDRGTAGDRYQVVIHVDAGDLAENAEAGPSVLGDDDDGIGVPAETSRRIACDASTVVMRHARDGTVLDVGRKTRTIPPAIRRALTARDRRCRFPGCHARHCDAHHVRHWADGGATRLNNLVLLCRHHHRAVHEEGFTVDVRDDGRASFFWPDGHHFPDVPPAPGWKGRPLSRTDQALDHAGVTIDAHTATPDWYGERLDLHWAIRILHPATADPVHRDVPAGTSRCVDMSESGPAT